MQARIFFSAVAMAVTTFVAFAEEPMFAAKSIFFGEDGDAKVVATEKKLQSEQSAQVAPKKSEKAVAINTGNPKTVSKTVAAAAKQSKQPAIGAAYFVRLKQEGAAGRDVLASHVFSTGDRFQLGLKVNRPSFVYIFNEDPTGKITMLYPRPGQSAGVDAMGTVFLPSQGSFQFQGPAGLERLLVLMSEEEIFQPDVALQKNSPDLITKVTDSSIHSSKQRELAQATDCRVMVADATDFSSKAIVYNEEQVATTEGCNSTPMFASKSIVFSDDPSPPAGQQVASYVVKPRTESAKSEPLFLKINLVHH